MIPSGMGGNQQTDDRPLRGECYGKTIVEIANGSAFGMGDLCIRRRLESGLDFRQVKPGILLAPSNDSTLARQDLIDRGLIAIQSIHSHADLAKGKGKRRRIRRDGLKSVSQFCAVIAVAWTRKSAKPLMRVRLQPRGPASSHVSALAPDIAFGAHLIKTALRGWKLLCLRKGSLSCCLFGPIDIDHLPVLSQAIPQPAWWRAERGSGHQVVGKQGP